MLRYCILLIVTLVASRTTLQVEVRNSEIWLIRNGEPTQLTRDGKSKLQALLSPSQSRIAYYEQCPQSEGCIPSIVILDLEGHRTKAFQPKHQAMPEGTVCASILAIAWTHENAIAAECHINPSLSEYVETDVNTGRVTRDLFGYDFVTSPDGKRVAHIGWVPHFSPPYAKSNYLQLDNTTIYPLPAGARPVEKNGLEGSRDVVLHRGLTFYGIYEITSAISWSPDSQRVAFVDCTYDWTAKNADLRDGTALNRRCSVVAISVSGRFKRFPLTDVNNQNIFGAQLMWINSHQISVRTDGSSKMLNLP
ncbi:MAG TPA: hypothetical protein VG759_17630 [Candidatus Angelobacter sp.]|jgi:hypothetical protein|nr:hypothetical protein [Candidatus Angelobacter sp.]